MTDINRRHFLISSAMSAATSIGGCLGASDFPRHRDLGFNEIELLDQTESEIVLRITPEMSWAGDSKEWGTFHDVRLLGYSQSDDIVCEAVLGDMVGRGKKDPVRLACETLPEEIRYVAEETPCDEDTLIEKAVLVGRGEEEPTWKIEDEECDG